MPDKLIKRTSALIKGASLAGCLLISLLVASCGPAGPEKSGAASGKPAATFAGSTTCQACHQQTHTDWMGSHHQLAMQEANEQTVLGDFNDATFNHHGIQSRFYKQDGAFFVNTEGPDGKNQDYLIAYCFGVYPLQQYLIKFPNGGMQVLQICWDSRNEELGGQRWYHLYPDEKIDYTDVLHWTKTHFNWNYMCADCHSTGLRKNFDPDTLTYNTTWEEINVSCEACHGPGSEHLAWAAKKEPGKTYTEKEMGLLVRFKESKPVTWAMNPTTLQPERSHPKEHDHLVDACARCHSHRRLVTGDYVHGQSLLDTHKPAVLEERLYHHDGQIKEEVYVYGSFVQSKMYHQGVTCKDCHDVHSTKVYAQGNALCLRCHNGGVYNNPTHHHHAADSTGSQCVSCHMPVKTYMGVDDRRDHSIRIPRPDLSLKLGTPNACNMCHTDMSGEQTANAFQEWYPEQVKLPHYGEVLFAGNRGTPGYLPELVKLGQDINQPALVRATAMWQLQTESSQEAMQGLLMGLEDSSALVREASLAGFSRVQGAQRISLIGKLLSDPVRAVRTEAMRVLADLPASLFTPELQAAFDRAQQDFVGQQAAVDDRAGGHMGLGILYADQGNFAASEAAYRKAFAVEPDHIESRLNLAEMLYQQNRHSEGLQLISQAVQQQPNNGLTHEALGRYWVRQQEYKRGLQSIATALRLMPQRADLRYFYGVGLNQVGDFNKALPQLEQAHNLDPRNPDYLAGLATICRDNRRVVEARSWAQKLVALDPSNPGYQQLLQSLR
ncbi:MAG: tetratricopeptide (TPR) repeat protein [Candidatus Omnitrophota bacterium]|jgi:tetratricopeptide (TPR) repeat protein